MVIGSAPTRRMYADYLLWRGVGVREVASAVAAIDYLTAFTPDAAVIEDRLSDSTGLDLVRTLRRCRATSRLPIALLSSDVFGIDETKASAHGCDLLLTIPCLPEALLTSLVQLVERRAAEPRLSPPDSWLFLKGGVSVRVVRTGDYGITICGPGHKRRELTFPTELDLVAFQVRYEQRLVKAGFAPEPFRAERRLRRDRRRIARGPDRRAP
jgi:CheY-like chemotaxis protein